MSVKPVPMDEVRKLQLAIFKERVKPFVTFAQKGIVVRRGLRRRIVKENPCEWTDTIYFEHPKMKRVSLWRLFYEKHLQFWEFETNPIEDRRGFIQELFNMLIGLEGSTLRPNDFRFVFDRPRKNLEVEGYLEIVRGREKFESERYPKQYKFGLKLVWRVKL
jgi:hypothetical protein